MTNLNPIKKKLIKEGRKTFFQDVEDISNELEAQKLCGQKTSELSGFYKNYKNKNYEYYCSGQFFEKIHHVKGEYLYNSAKDGDSNAIKIFNVFGEHLGNLLTQVMYAYDPEQIILGGSISKAYGFFKNGIQKSFKNYAYQNSISNLKINISNDPDIPIKGAASLCF